MKKISYLACAGMLAWAFAACEPVNPITPPNPQDSTDVPVDTITTDTIPTDTIPTDTIPTDTIPADTTETHVPLSFPKKHLIEEFTGQDCGYCPGGMDAIHEFMGNDTNWVLILHHYGYMADHFSVSGSKKITGALGVSGAPSASIDRKKTKTPAGTTLVFHPGYLPNVDKEQFDSTTFASVHIANTYDPATRELNVTVSGEADTVGHKQLFITVVVKESGMIDYQADYDLASGGWTEFRHCNAVRAFLTAPKGDSLFVTNQAYNEVFSITLNDNWEPDNCSVVAFISETFKPVVQAEQRPVVEGTAGGNDIVHGGITPAN